MAYPNSPQAQRDLQAVIDKVKLGPSDIPELEEFRRTFWGKENYLGTPQERQKEWAEVIEPWFNKLHEESAAFIEDGTSDGDFQIPPLTADTEDTEDTEDMEDTEGVEDTEDMEGVEDTEETEETKDSDQIVRLELIEYFTSLILEKDLGRFENKPNRFDFSPACQILHAGFFGPSFEPQTTGTTGTIFIRQDYVRAEKFLDATNSPRQSRLVVVTGHEGEGMV